MLRQTVDSPGFGPKLSGGAAQARSARAACGLRLVGAPTRWHTMALAVLLASLFGLSWPARAGLWSADTVAAYGLEAELEQLGAIRERIVRREALRQALRRTVRELSREIGVLGRRGEQVLAELASYGDAVRAQERALDRVVPRLVARLQAVEQRRGQAARALADLASLSRRQELDPELRARLRAIGPVLLTLLRHPDAASAALARQHDRLVERRQWLAARLPMLRAELERLHDRREDRQDRRRGALQELLVLDAELRRLARARAALARPMLVIEAAHEARAEPDAARPAQDRRARIAVAGASLRGRADRPGSGSLASGTGRALARMAAVVTRQAEPLQIRLAPSLALRQPLPQAARALAGRYDRVGAVGETRSTVAPLARVSIAMSAALSSRVARARLPLPAPIRPAAVAAGLDGHGHETGITIVALPGQRVAAPQDGRIVFADVFKSYGLLLIIEHDSEYHTLLWGFSKLRVAVGDEVRGGEIVGVMDVVDGVPPRLGVELRRRGRPVNPLPWLAASSSKVRG
jgi:septal ring factor EnvC (AmiA/AmiB activator)